MPGLLVASQHNEAGADNFGRRIPIPLVRIEASQKSAKGVHLADLAEYLDARAKARKRNDRAYKVTCFKKSIGRHRDLTHESQEWWTQTS